MGHQPRRTAVSTSHAFPQQTPGAAVAEGRREAGGRRLGDDLTSVIRYVCLMIVKFGPDKRRMAGGLIP